MTARDPATGQQKTINWVGVFTEEYIDVADIKSHGVELHLTQPKVRSPSDMILNEMQDQVNGSKLSVEDPDLTFAGTINTTGRGKAGAKAKKAAKPVDPEAAKLQHQLNLTSVSGHVTVFTTTSRLNTVKAMKDAEACLEQYVKVHRDTESEGLGGNIHVQTSELWSKLQTKHKDTLKARMAVARSFLAEGESDSTPFKEAIEADAYLRGVGALGQGFSLMPLSCLHAAVMTEVEKASKPMERANECLKEFKAKVQIMLKALTKAGKDLLSMLKAEKALVTKLTGSLNRDANVSGANPAKQRKALAGYVLSIMRATPIPLYPLLFLPLYL
jgi:hypothetical protein